MISYEPFYRTLYRKNITEYQLIFKHGVSANTLHRMKHGECCFSERMRKLFRKNEKNVLRFCNKKAKEKRRLQRVKKPM